MKEFFAGLDFILILKTFLQGEKMKKRKTFIPFFLLAAFGLFTLNFSARHLSANADENLPNTENVQLDQSSSSDFSETPAVAEKKDDTAENDVAENMDSGAEEKNDVAENTNSGAEEKENAESSNVSTDSAPLSLYELFKSGGLLMIPISIMSILVLAVGFERFWGLRKGAVLPRKLCHNVDVQVSAKADPRAIYALCKKNRSAFAKVIQAALFKAGRPMSEVNETIRNAKEDEANRLYCRVRFLVLAAAVTPLIGLLGTVVGMIQAFMATASTTGIQKAEMLSQGIYLALVTTCAGLIVAIPAAILAHWYEGKIQKLFYRMDRQLVNFISYLEGLEGKVRFTPNHYRTYVRQKTESR